MNLASRPLLPLPLLTSLLAFGAALLPCRSAAQSTAAPAAELMFVYSPAMAHEPFTDSRAEVIAAPMITLPASDATKATSGVQGRLEVRVLEDGSVGRVRFESPRPAKGVMAEIERGLANWRFEPLLRSGKPTQTWVPLVYSSTPASTAGADSVPRTILAVLPDYPMELWRPWAQTGAAAPVVSMPGDSAPRPPSRSSMNPGVEGPSRRAAIGGNTRSTPAPGLNALGKAGSGPASESHAPWFSGHVTLRVDVDEHGIPSNPEVVRSTASLFEPLAAAAVTHWIFAPAIQGGKPVASRMIVPVSFPGTIDNPPPLFFKPDPQAAESWDEPPRMRHLDLPVYPQGLLAEGVTGRASARVALDLAGNITNVTLLDATRPEFGHALVASIERCQHDPARHGGRRVAATLIRTAVFDRGLWNQKPGNAETPSLTLPLTDAAEAVPEARLDTPLVRITGKPPAFAGSGASGAAATATVEFIVSSDGRVQEPGIVESSSPAAGYAAIQAVAAWRYAAPLSEGAPTPALVRVKFSSADATH